MSANNINIKVALIGSTGRAGGWVLEECLSRGYSVTTLVRTASKLEAYQDRISVVEGDATDAQDVRNLIYGNGDDNSDEQPKVQVVISTIGSPNKETLVVKKAAEALVKALKDKSASSNNIPRIIWMTSTGINEATNQAKSYTIFGKSSRWLFGYGFFGLLQFKILIPYIIGQDLWDDMEHSETVIRSADNGAIVKHTVIVRPGNMYPVSEAATFSEQWRKEGGENENLEYIFVGAEDSPPGNWIGRRALAAAICDLIKDTSHDGVAVSVFQQR